MISLHGNTIYFNETPVAAIIDGEDAVEFKKIMAKLAVLDLLEAKVQLATGNVGSMARLVRELAQNLDITPPPPNVEDMLE